MNVKANEHVSSKKGFTLLELLIVIAIIVLLGIILIFALNPAETLAKSRDAQRISDLASLKTAIGVYVTTVSGTPDLSAGATNHVCLTGTAATATVSYSADLAADADCSSATEPTAGDDTSATFQPLDYCVYIPTANGVSDTDGSGWVSVDLGSIIGGSPISSLPLDPTNSVSGTLGDAPVNSDLVYRYVCQEDGDGTKPDYVFELNAQLESTSYTTAPNDIRTKDGGDTAGLYEVGTSVLLITSGAF